MRLKGFLLSIIVFFAPIIMAQTTLRLNASDYKNENLFFYATSDYISQLTDTIAYVKADENGAVEFNFKLNNTRQIFIDLGIYHCSFYVEKGTESISINLPKKRLKTKVELLNIYFESTNLHLVMDGDKGSSINPLIISFDKIYTEFITTNFDSIYTYPQREIIDEFEQNIKNYYSEINNEYFKNYVQYKINTLRFLGPNRSYKTVTFKYFNEKPVLYSNTAYMYLFNMMYKDFFNIYADTKDGVNHLNLVTEGRSVIKLQNFLAENSALSDPNLEELIILKSLHDELFNPRTRNNIHFPTPQIKIILDSISDFSQVKEHQRIAKNIIAKVNQEFENNKKELSNFNLIGFEGDTVSLKDFQGKYLYLNFMRTDILPAMENMDRMINFYNSHKEDIEIVSIFTDSYLNFTKLDTSKYKWKLLYIGDRQDLLKEYKVITWPKFFLISPESKLIWSPAYTIKEGFEIKFFDYIDKDIEN